jgi:hypothetical protein
MSLSDKILNLIAKFGNSSSERVTNMLRTEYGITRSVRTVQRLILGLVEAKKLMPLSSSGREQLYAIFESKRSTLSQYFLSKFWDELFKLRDILNSKDQSIYPRDIFDKLRSLVKMLPKNMKDQIMPSIETFWDIKDVELKELQEQWNTEVGPAPILFFEKERRELGYSIVNMAYRKKLENLIDIVSTALHEAIEGEENNE